MNKWNKSISIENILKEEKDKQEKISKNNKFFSKLIADALMEHYCNNKPKPWTVKEILMYK